MSRILAKDAAKFSYVLPGGEHVPSVTTILRLLHKKGLEHWMWKQGRLGIPINQASDKEISIGKIAHYCIECNNEKAQPQFEGFSQKEIDTGEEISERLSQLLEHYNGKVISSELALVDKENKFGGTIDLLVKIPGNNELWDIKTSKQLYIDHYIQCMAYQDLLYANDYGRPTPRLVLLTKDGRVHAPDISLAMQEYALQAWRYLLPCYHAYKKLEKEMNV